MNELAADSLPNNLDELKQLLLERESQHEQVVTRKEKRILHLEQMIQYLKFKQYGRSSERHLSPQEEMVFNEAEQWEESPGAKEEVAASLEAEDEAKRSESPPKTRGRRRLPENLPRHKIYHDLDESRKQCDCGCELEPFDEVTSEQLSVIPAEIYVIQHCRKKYRCRACKEKAPVTAPLPPQPLPKSNASAELLSHIAVSKFLDGLPFYRQEKIWERVSIALPRATQANWMIGCGKLIQSLANLLFDHHAEGSVIHIDETPVQVLKEPDKPPDGKKYFWLSVGGPPDKLGFRYHYNPSRGSDVALDLLQGFRGAVISDDWAVYGKVCEKLQLRHIACNDHARRKFKDAEKALPKNRKKTGVIKSEMALSFYRKLYAIERRIKNDSVEIKTQVRQCESLPVWEKFIEWMEKHLNNVTPESAFGKALHYTYKLKEKLSYYCQDGSLPISNEKAENAIRPFAIARKNFLFFDSPKGADASANLYSLIITAQHHGLNPFYYLAHVFKCLPLAQTVEEIEKLLPWAIDNEALEESFTKFKRGGD